jgi:hypothetical protein
LKILKRVLGLVLLIIASFMFVVFTASINSPQSMGGPMGMGPSPTEWSLFVLFIDAVWFLIGVAGSKMLGLSRKFAGGLMVLVGISALMLAIQNHLNSPDIDDLNKGLQMPVPFGLHVLVYLVSALSIIAGLIRIFRVPSNVRI